MFLRRRFTVGGNCEVSLNKRRLIRILHQQPAANPLKIAHRLCCLRKRACLQQPHVLLSFGHSARSLIHFGCNNDLNKLALEYGLKCRPVERYVESDDATKR